MMQSAAVAGQNIPKLKSLIMGERDIYSFNHAILNLREFIGQGDYPDWWVWCFDEGVRRFSQDPTNQFVAGLYGLCITQPDTGYDFGDLISYLDQSGEEALVGVVSLDKLAARETPWLLAGVNSAHGATTRIAIEYGKVSSRVWSDYLKEKPLSAALQVVKAHVIFYLYGVNFLGGDQYEPQLRLRPKLVRWVGYLFSPILFIGSLVSYLLIAYRLIGWERLKWPRLDCDSSTCRAQILLVFAVGLCLTAFVMNSLSCCENARFFMSLSPLALPVGICVLHDVIRSYWYFGA